MLPTILVQRKDDNYMHCYTIKRKLYNKEQDVMKLDIKRN